MLALTIAASEQALNRQFTQASCTLASKVGSFVNGEDGWIGVGNLVGNLTRLQLNLNTRVKAARNSINSLQLNGTVAGINFIGFPNNITTINPLNGSTVTLNTV